MIGMFSKRLIFTAIIVLLFHTLSAQRFQGAVIGGFNLSKVAGDEVNGFYHFLRIGANVGAAAIIPFGRSWDVTLETTFTQKGAFQGETPSNDMYPWRYDLRLNYVEVPLLVHYNDRDILTAGAGFSWGRLVYVEENEDNGNRPSYQDSVAFNENDFSFVADVRFRVWKRMHMNFRVSHSIVPIRERVFDRPASQFTETNKQYNFVLSFRLVYIFNEKLRPKVQGQ